MVVCLERDREVQIYIWPNECHCHSLSLASVKSRLVLVPAHPGNPRQNPEGRNTDVCVYTYKTSSLSTKTCYMKI